MAQRKPHTIRVTSTNVRDRRRVSTPVSAQTPSLPHVSRPSRPIQKRGEARHIGERLLRDCALSAAVILCVLALGNIQQPWAQSVSASVRDAVTLNLGESLGKLQFVRNILPESALVFWDMGSDQAAPATQTTYQIPATGEVVHAWAQDEPWLEYACQAQSVVAAASGEVMAITQGDAGRYMVRLRHADNTETLYGELVTRIVSEGETLQAGQILGAVEKSFLFEARRDGRVFNPTDLMRVP